MKPYKDWSPTPYDLKGLALPDMRNWLVAPCLQTRDSGALERSNWQEQLERLRAVDDTVEVHSFNHWGPGWFDIVLIPPDSPAVAVGLEIEKSLAEYPSLNDDLWSQIEADDHYETHRRTDPVSGCCYCSDGNFDDENTEDSESDD